MTPKFIITSRPHTTTIDLVLDGENEMLPLVDTYTMASTDTLFALRVMLRTMWDKYHYAAQPESTPLPPLPSVQWVHQP